MRHIIKLTNDAIRFADSQIKYAISTILAIYGFDGMELPCHDDGTYFVTAEIKPNEFKRVKKVRCVPSVGAIEMMLEGSDKWEWCMFVDWRFLFEEIANTYNSDEFTDALPK